MQLYRRPRPDIPRELWALWALAFLLWLSSLLFQGFAPLELRSLLVPHLGWSPGAGFSPIALCLPFVFFERQALGPWRGRLMFIAVACGLLLPIADYFQRLAAGPCFDCANPWLRFGEYRWFSSVLLPLGALALLSSRSVREWFWHGRPECDARD